MPTFRQISANESLLGPPNISHNLLPLRILPLERAVGSPDQLSALLSDYRRSRYLLSVQPGEAIPWWQLQDRCLEQYRSVQHLAVALQHGAAPRDILTAVLEAAHLRAALRQQGQGYVQPCSTVAAAGGAATSEGSAQSSGGSSRGVPAVQLPVEPLRVSTADASCTSGMRRAARRAAEGSVDRFMRDLTAGGWQVRPFLLSTSERMGFVKV